MAEPTIVVGLVTKAHGLRGEVAVQNRSDNPERWVSGSVMFTQGGRTLTVRAVRPHGERLIVTFAEVSDRDDAEVTIHREGVSSPDQRSDLRNTGYTRQTILARNDGAVDQHAAPPLNDSRRERHNESHIRIDGVTHQDFAVSEGPQIGRLQDDPRHAGIVRDLKVRG